jgi:hypothetical protein
MDILFFCDDPDDSTIFIDIIHDINADINCIIMSSNDDAISVFTQTKVPMVFLDYNNLPKKFVKTVIKYLRGNELSRKTKVIIYSNQFDLTMQENEELNNLGASDFVIKTSDLFALRKSILNSLK